MSTSTATMSLDAREHGLLVRVLAAGAVVGILDITYAWVVYSFLLGKATVIQVPQSIASGLLGKAAYSGGLATASLGMLLHFTIAYTWTCVYLVLARISLDLRRLLATEHGVLKVGMTFGALMWLVMDLIVLPLSHARPAPIASWPFVTQLVWHAVGLGVPLAFIVRDGGASASAWDLDSRGR